MDKYHKTEDRPLEPKELAKLKRGFWVIPIFLLLFGGFFVLLFNNLNPNDGFSFWMPVGMAVFFAGLLGYITWGFVMDLSQQTKQVFQGLITRKESRMGTGKSKRSSYYLYFGEKRMRVELYIYNKFNEGDLVEIHRSKRLYNMIYKTEVLNRDKMSQLVAEVKQSHMNQEMRVAFIAIFLFVATIGALIAAVFLGWIEW